MDKLAGAAAIVGLGDVYGSIEHRRTPLELAAKAVTLAVYDAGLSKRDIEGQGFLTGRSPFGGGLRQQWNNVLASYLHVSTKVSTEVTLHVAGTNAMLKHAAMQVATGLCDYVVCAHADVPSINMGDSTPSEDTDPDLERPLGPTMPGLYAMIARRYMHEFGVSESQFARVAVQAQNWAVEHPHSAKGAKGRITVDDVLSSRIIASPLHLWDCAIWGPASGTAGAVVVTSAERARDMSDNPIRLLGFGEWANNETFSERLEIRNGVRPPLTTTGTAVAAKQAYEMSGLGPEDMNLVGATVNFSHMGLILMEDLGFAEKGSGASLFDSGRTDVEGNLPVNTNGGWMSFGQPGVGCGMDTVVETVRQLRGSALGKQVQEPRYAVLQNMGGPHSCHSVSVLGK